MCGCLCVGGDCWGGGEGGGWSAYRGVGGAWELSTPPPNKEINKSTIVNPEPTIPRHPDTRAPPPPPLQGQGPAACQAQEQAAIRAAGVEAGAAAAGSGGSSSGARHVGMQAPVPAWACPLSHLFPLYCSSLLCCSSTGGGPRRSLLCWQAGGSRAGARAGGGLAPFAKRESNAWDGGAVLRIARLQNNGS